MIIFIPDMLSTEELGRVQSMLESVRFVEGASTAGGAAREVKRNQQLPPGTRQYEQLADIMRAAFQRNTTIQSALLPASGTRVVFNRYDKGMEYGAHVDAPLMGVMGNLLRADIAITLFLSDPESYVGGELTIKVGENLSHKFKEAAGSAVAYPANSLHHVTPVCEGRRDAAIWWVQSLVRDPARRDLLWDLENAQQDIYNREGRSKAFEAVNRSHKNLMRMWAND